MRARSDETRMEDDAGAEFDTYALTFRNGNMGFFNRLYGIPAFKAPIPGPRSSGRSIGTCRRPSP